MAAQKSERNTKQKAAVYEALCALDHPTATEVYEFVRRTYPTLSRGTVFRVLGGFAESGRIRKICLADSDVRYDPTLAPHAHARCRVCGRVRDVGIPCAQEAFRNVKVEGFCIDGFETEFFGVCESCKNTAKIN